eukprot:COSAG06_NODE_1643_length_8827_cov_1.799496_5_plen_223_part_00
MQPARPLLLALALLAAGPAPAGGKRSRSGAALSARGEGGGAAGGGGGRGTVGVLAGVADAVLVGCAPAASGDCAAKIEAAVAAGGDLNAVVDGETPLIFAAANGRARAVEALLVQGADAGRTEAAGNTALHAAAHAGHAEAVRLLLAGGASEPLNRDGFAPIHLACKGDDVGHTEAFEALLQAGVRLDAPTAEGQSCATFFLQNKATRKLVKAARKAAKSDL